MSPSSLISSRLTADQASARRASSPKCRESYWQIRESDQTHLRSGTNPSTQFQRRVQQYRRLCKGRARRETRMASKIAHSSLGLRGPQQFLGTASARCTSRSACCSRNSVQERHHITKMRDKSSSHASYQVAYKTKVFGSICFFPPFSTSQATAHRSVHHLYHRP